MNYHLMNVHVMVSCQPYIDPKPEKEVSETAGMSPICRERCLPAEKSTLWLVFLFCTFVFLFCAFVFQFCTFSFCFVHLSFCFVYLSFCFVHSSLQISLSFLSGHLFRSVFFQTSDFIQCLEARFLSICPFVSKII